MLLLPGKSGSRNPSSLIMQIKELELKNYRNHETLKLEFASEGKLILGNNGTGKTNIIEAINFLSTGKPFRARYDREVIQHNKGSASIKSIVHTREKEAQIGIMIKKSEKYDNASSKKVKVNGKNIKIGTLSQLVNCVLFSPLTMNLLINSPSTRRDFLNDILEQSDPKYKKTLRDYKKARRQKNKILEIIKETGKGESQLDYWSEKVLAFGKKIQEKRTELIDFFNKELNSKLEESKMPLETQVKYDINVINQKRLDNYRSKEIAAGTSLIGPHRDDFELYDANEKNLGSYASRGQQRTLILGLKLCELDYLEEKTEQKPILLLDDIFSELDKKHKSTINSLVLKQQTILTATETPKAFESFPKTTLK